MQPGALIVPSTEVVRCPPFVGSLMRLVFGGGLPEGSVLYWHQGCDIPYELNHGIRRMLADPALQWAWIMGDDHTFLPDVLMRLLAHDVPVVAPLVLRRNVPNHTVIYDAEHKPVSLDREARGLLSVHAVGNAGMLIRRSALDAIGDPWFTHRTPERSAEDLAFCDSLREHGIPIYVDVDTWMGHVTPVEVWPHRADDGTWQVKYHNRLTMEVL